MKYYIRISFILCAAFGALTAANAQTAEETEPAPATAESNGAVQAAFRQVPEIDLMGGISVVNMAELIDKNYTTYSLDNMQAFVGGWSGNALWGLDDFLVLVDGVPRDANNVVPTEIEQISFLKGASAVLLYGSRAAKGVVYITTKRGNIGPLKVDVRANTGFHVAKSYPKYLGSAEYMTLYNEALTNDGELRRYSDEDIYHTASGLNPYRYPDVDFFSSEFIRPVYNRSDVTAELRGGDERSRFYTNIGYFRQNDVFKFGEAKDNYTDRLNVRGNVDLKISNTISAFVNANATFYNARSGNAADSDPDDPNNVDNYWTYSATMRPNRVAPLIPLSYIDENALNSLETMGAASNIIDGKYFLAGSQTDLRNIFADYYAAGSSKWTSRQFQFDAGLNFDLARVLKGLTFHTQYAVDYATSYNTSYDNTYRVYEPSWYNYNGQDVIAHLEPLNNDRRSGVQNITGSSNRQTIAFSSYFNYVTSVNEDHNFSSRLVASGFQQTRSQVYHRTGNANLGLQVNYNYQNRYYVDLGSAIVHSAKLAKGNRTGLSSSATLGWRLSKEGFLNGSSVVDDLVISASGSVLKTDIDIRDGDNEFYLYQSNYAQAEGAWWGWRDGASERSTNSLRGDNPDLDFVNRKEVSLNIRTSLWDRLITADVSLFLNRMEGLTIQPTTLYPSYFSTGYPNSSFMPFMNYNDQERRGVDFNINVNRQIGEVGLTFGISGMYYTSEATKFNEIVVDEYNIRTGRPVDAIWGLESAGLFQNQAEVDASPTQVFAGEAKPGDIKYVDQNDDGIIDVRDEVFLGRAGWNGGPFAGGLHITARWKGFTLFALATGNFGAYAVKNDPYFWAAGNTKYSEVVRDRWTEATAGTATYPRLTATNGANNYRNSDFWLYKTDRFDLARVQLTYDLPSDMFQTSFFNNVSVYVSGANLLTLSEEREILELNIGEAPQTRFYNLGVRAAF